MISIEFTEIRTERLLLGTVKSTDWKMISYLRSDREVNQFVKRPSAESEEEALAFITKAKHDSENRILYYWIIREKDQDQMIGSICLWNLSKEENTAELGYDLSPEFQGKGIMNEAMVSVCDFGFSKLKVGMIEAFTQKQNEASKRLLERNGFVHAEDRKDDDNPDNLIFELRKLQATTPFG